MALCEMSGDTIAALPEQHLENAVRNLITDALEGAGFVPNGVMSDGMNTHQRYIRGDREVIVATTVLT